MSQPGIINYTKHLKRPGLDSASHYEAVVVENNDPKKRCRIKARIQGLMDNIKDEHLPWASPIFHHVDGAFGGENGSGVFFVPKKGSKVSLRFPNKDPHFPVWGPYTVDDKTVIPEMNKNYPDRAVIKLQNGWYIIIDTKTNEFFLNVPGDMNMTVLGNLNQYIVGNMQTVVAPTKSQIPGYVSSGTALANLAPKPTANVPFTGLLDTANASGHAHSTTKGDQSYSVDGNYKLVIKGNYDVEVGKNATIKVGRNTNIKTSGVHKDEASRIDHN